MSNQLSMAKVHSIATLHDSGHSNREIARLLGVKKPSGSKHRPTTHPVLFTRHVSSWVWHWMGGVAQGEGLFGARRPLTPSRSQ